ncbi:MAG: hypothetical protein FWD51_02525 [Betaproteobacteria bacterium]|nr:hypothetical protein [Betaproteobacteria bacterium]
MAKQENRKGGVSKLARTETVTIRLDSRLRYLAELASRVQRRTVSSFIEWAVQESLKHVDVCSADGCKRSIADEVDKLWDVDEPDRLVRLAFHYPGLLTYEEQIIWKHIRESGYLWKSEFIDGKRVWKIEEANLDMGWLRRDWKMFVSLASGEDVDAWFLEQREKYSLVGGSVYEDKDGYFYVDAEGCVRVDRDGNIHINKDAYLTLDENGDMQVSMTRRTEAFKPVMSLLDVDGIFQQDEDGNVFIDRRTHPLVAKENNDQE